MQNCMLVSRRLIQVFCRRTTMSSPLHAIDELKHEASTSNDKEKRKVDNQDYLHKNRKKQKLLKKHERPGNGEDRFDETDYYFENGLRKVYPYYYTFTTYCKGRWMNRKLIDVFAAEFMAQPLYEFERNIKSGQITVNGSKVDPEYVLKNNDLIANTVHRHEVPVNDEAIKVIHLSDELVVIDKPCSIPVHPCGRYRHNSAVFILGKEFNLRDLRSAYRLDRLTSGLVIFSRNLSRDQKLKREISSRLVEKHYICKVEGVFPNEPVVCSEQIEVLSHRIGICRVGPNGKESQTHFERLICDGKTSVVLCKPRTGRMHQIRVHLQYLGYPILNDPLYNNAAFGPLKGKQGNINKSEEELIRDLVKDNIELQWFVSESDSNSIPGFEICPATSSDSSAEVKLLKEVEHPIESTSKHFDPSCGLCLGRVKFQDPKPDQLMMYLHCWKYKGPDWEFETEIPKWARGEWTEGKL